MRIVCVLVIAAAASAEWIPVSKGLPKKDGLGKLAIVTNLAGSKAVKHLAKERDAKIIKLKGGKVASARMALRRIGPEFVAFAVKPETVDINFQLDVLELCRNLDDDPMPDFHFGYLCARDGKDLMALVDRILTRESTPPDKPVAKLAALTKPGTQLYGIDYLLHFGHGQAWKVHGGLTGVALGKLSFPRAPIVFSGACFNGVLSRSYHPCAYQPSFMVPKTVEPKYLMTLNWVHAGASAYLAALEGDRGEMAIAEWEYFRARACSLGEAIGVQYRLAFVSLPADFTGFPRYVPGRRKNMSFYWVMMRGAVSRILLSDPSYRPLRAPMTKKPSRVDVDVKDDAVHVTVKVERTSQGHFLNYLPKVNDGRFDHRITERIAVPAETAAPAAPTATRNGKVIEFTRTRVRHEVWGGQRYVNLQAESKNGALASVGAELRWKLPLK